MYTCKECSCKAIKSRRNYTHGKKSRPTTILRCKNCNSLNLEKIKPKRKR